MKKVVALLAAAMSIVTVAGCGAAKKAAAVEPAKKAAGIETEKIERIVPMYPMSEDESRYSRLIKVLSLYRLTMGQPRQEELLQMLEGKISQEQIKQLLFDLSPFCRNNKQMQK